MTETGQFERLASRVAAAGRAFNQRTFHLPGRSLAGTPLGDYLARPVNWLFLLTALVMWSVAWPTLGQQFDVPSVLLVVISGLSVLPIAVAWIHPRAAWLIITATAGVFPMLSFQVRQQWYWNWQVSLIISLLLVVTIVFLRTRLGFSVIAWIVTAVFFAINASPGSGLGWAVGITMLFGVCLLLRLALTSRSQLEQQAEVSDLERSKRAILEERARIARDLHDIVAHRMSLVVVAAQTAPYRVPDVSDRVRGEFDAIAVSAREALNEVRALLGLLRLDGATADFAPAPGLGGIDELIDGARLAGIPIDYLPLADADVVSESTALVAYRIVQESIANATRHAQGSAITVSLTRDGATVNLRIENGPRTSDADLGGPGLGQGIAGMMERVRSIGGSLAAMPTTGGGFVVTASLPTRVEQPA